MVSCDVRRIGLAGQPLSKIFQRGITGIDTTDWTEAKKFGGYARRKVRVKMMGAAALTADITARKKKFASPRIAVAVPSAYLASSTETQMPTALGLFDEDMRTGGAWPVRRRLACVRFSTRSNARQRNIQKVNPG